MLHASELSIMRAIAIKRLSEGGRTVEISTDFAELEEELAVAGKDSLSAEFSPGKSRELSPENCVFIVIRGAEGDIDAFCAARVVDLQDGDLASFLFDQYRDLYANGRTPFDADDLPPPAYQITGKAGYIGDYIIFPHARGKGGIDGSALAVLAYETCYSEWGVDWIYCLTKNRSALRGLAARYLAARTYPCAIPWRVEVPKRRDDDWFLALDRRDIQWTARKYIQRDGDFNVR